MHPKITIRIFFLLTLLASLLYPAANAYGVSNAAVRPPAPVAEATAYDLIIAMNTLRASNGGRQLEEDPIIDAVAQSTAQIMADNQMSWHIGNVSGRLASAGYGGGAKVWATENFAAGSSYEIDEIMQVWSDDAHMIPAVNPAYCSVGAGVAKSSNGLTYYVLQAAYTSGKSCGEYKSPGGTNPPGGGKAPGVPGIIVPVKVASPDAEGKVYHIVESGQSFWSIAVAYKITIKDLEVWNNISKDTKLQIGQKLFIPGKNTKGYFTPTPVGMIQVSKPDKNGKIVHTVAAYQTLSTISKAYNTNVDTILKLNNIQADWPLQIGQKLIIHGSNVTPSATPRPLKPVEKLTPANDGKFYHTVKSGESLSWIASLYEVNVIDLMNWNGLNDASILQPNQKVLLLVTPPATSTHTPGPATNTPTVTIAPPTATASLIPTQAVSTLTSTAPSPAVEGAKAERGTPILLYVFLGVLSAAIVLLVVFGRQKA